MNDIKLKDIILYSLQINCGAYSIYCVVGGAVTMGIGFMFALYLVAYIQEYVLGEK